MVDPTVAHRGHGDGVRRLVADVRLQIRFLRVLGLEDLRISDTRSHDGDDERPVPRRRPVFSDPQSLGGDTDVVLADTPFREPGRQPGQQSAQVAQCRARQSLRPDGVGRPAQARRLPGGGARRGGVPRSPHRVMRHAAPPPSRHAERVKPV